MKQPKRKRVVHTNGCDRDHRRTDRDNAILESRPIDEVPLVDLETTSTSMSTDLPFSEKV